ncbi:MAG: DUF6456 domain-containing protein [Paracoccaceae bacterium]
MSIRRLAKGAGCHASTILRQVRKIETQRDDPLIDEALTGLVQPAAMAGNSKQISFKDSHLMTQQIRFSTTAPDDETINREGRRILRRLREPGAFLAVAKDLEKAVIVRETDQGRTVRTAVVDRPIAQAMALKGWISCPSPARISRYKITSAGKAALSKLLEDDDGARVGFAEAPARFEPKFATGGNQGMILEAELTQGRTSRYKFTESPVSSMARRKDKAGNPFLSPELVTAAERLREDFEVAQMGSKRAPNWEQVLTGDTDETSETSSGARKRVSDALRDLGPGLGDVALRVCCMLEGLETAEKRMGWSARSGKVVLRIALLRLKQHYDRNTSGSLIG